MNIFKKALLVVLGAGLVVVPSTVDKVEEVNAASNIPTGTVLYVKPGSNWNQSSARFAAYFFGSENTWVSAKASTESGIYYVTTPAGTWTNVIFCRMNPSTTTNNWDNKWNQTGDLTYESPKNLFTVSNSSWDGATTTWSEYFEFDFVLDYNYDGAPADKSTDVKRGTYTLDLETPTRDGYNFLGWSTSETATTGEYFETYSNNFENDVTLYAVWEEMAASDCHVTYVVNGHNYNVTATVGTTIEENIPEIAGYNVLAWDKTGEVTGDATITATKYYKTFDQVKGELNFSYNYYLNLVVFQCPIGYEDGVPTVTGTNTKTGATKSVEMSWCADAPNEKKEWYTNLDTQYDQLTFTWKNKGVAQTHTVTRDYEKNAIWYDSASSNGNYAYDISSNSIVASKAEYVVNRVSDMKLRVGTLALLASDFAGVETYGIRIAKGNTIADDNYYGPTWAAADVAKVDANGNADEDGEYIRWNAVINNIPTENYNDEFTAVAYVVIDGVSYDICEARTVSVTSLASVYASSLSGVEAVACQFIVDTYQA